MKVLKTALCTVRRQQGVGYCYWAAATAPAAAAVRKNNPRNTVPTPVN
jgi:hypothetical protein